MSADNTSKHSHTNPALYKTYMLGYLFVLLVVFYLSLRGFKGIWEVNDFEVIRHGALLAWQHSQDLYSIGTPVQARGFLYPPTGAIVLIPFAWLPYHLSGVIFTLLRITILGLFFLVAIQWLREEKCHIENRYIPWIILCTLFFTFRYINNEFGNGQINIVLSSFVVIGLWLAFRPTRLSKVVGGILICLPVAIKVSPFIFFFLLLLRRKWLTFAIGIVALCLLFITTFAWFGTQESFILFDEWKIISDNMSCAAIDTDRVISLHEFLVSVASTWGITPTPHIIHQWWILELILLCTLFLVLRFRKSSRQNYIPPLWDVSMFIIGMLLVSPLVRKAHLVYLLLPNLYILSIILGCRDLKQSCTTFWLASVSGILLLGSVSIPLEKLIPGYNANPTLFVALVILACCLYSLNFPEKKSA